MKNKEVASNIIEKVRKCLALAHGKGATEAEAAAALKAAHKLMRKHNLEMSDVDFKKIEEEGPKKADTGKPRAYMASWEMSLARVCDELFETEHYVNDANYRGWTGSMRNIVFIGLGADAAIASEAYKILRKIVQRLGSSRGYKGSALREYCEGVVMTLNNRAYEMMEKSKEANVKTKAMVVVKSDIVEKWVEDNIYLASMKTRGASGEAGTFSQGAQDGNSVNLSFRDSLDQK